MTFVTEDMLEAARAGAALLDEKLGPAGWRPLIDTSRLDVSLGDFVREDPHSCGCVLAQIFRYFTSGVAVLGLFDEIPRVERIAKAKSLGFLEWHYSPPGALEEAWRIVLAEGPA